MIERLVSLTLHNRGMVIVAALLIITAGLYSWSTLPIDAFPDVTNIQVEIVGNAPGLSPLEIERFVTYPIENAMRGLPGLAELRSTTKFGLAVVTLVFEDDVDLHFARQLVFQRLEEATKNVPKGVDIGMGPVATAMGEIYQYTLEGTLPDDSAARIQRLAELRTLQEWVIAPALKSVPGVNEINSFGGYLKEYHVEVAPDKLLKYGLTVDDVYRAIEAGNENVGGNILDRHDEQFIVRGIGLLRTADDIGSIVLQSHDGVPVMVRDVADVRIGEAVRQGAALIDGTREAVGGIVMMLRGANAREVVRRIHEKVQEINSGSLLPDGVTIAPYYDRTDIVEASTGTVNRALLEGAILVLLILLVMLRSLRSALVVLLALPLSLLLTAIVMRIVGLDANLMSLGGLAISIGMIIDATIIQVENVQRHLVDAGEARHRLRTVLTAVMEVRKPSIFGELIIAVTFIPIITLQGLEGRMFAPLALTVAVALLSSLLLSIFIIPALTSLVLRPGVEKPSPILRLAARIVAPQLDWSLTHRKTVTGIAVAVFAGALLLATQLGTEFIPVMDEGAFDMDVQMLPGTSLDRALATTALIERKVRAFPELRLVVSRTGQTGIALEARGVDKTGFTGVFEPREKWVTSTDKEAIINAMRDSLASIPGIVVSFSQPIQCRIDELIAGTKAQLIIKLFGDDLDLLRRKSAEIARVVSGITGATDVVVERVAGQPYLSLTVQRDRIARHGLTVGDVMRIIEIAVGGKAATQLYEANRSFDVRIRFPESARNSVETIGNILVPTPGGANIPLNQLCDIAVVDGPVQVSREDGQRRIGIELNVDGRDIGGFVAEAKRRIRDAVQLPPGTFIVWGGQFENQERAMTRLAVILPVSILLILGLLFLTFRSMRLAALVITNLPFALIGGVVALAITGQYLSVPASIGFIVLFGVAVLNGVVLVSHINELLRSGLPMLEAVRQGTIDRLRPVLMTATISIFSLIPMFFANGPGSEIQRPLATVVIGGLFTSTFLTLVLLPTLHVWFGRRIAE